MCGPLRLLLVLAVLATACAGTEAEDATPAPVSPTTGAVTTSSTPPTATAPTTTTATTSAPPSTTAAPPTTSTTSTTTLPSALDIEGSPLIEFSIEVDPDLGDELRHVDLVAFVVETLGDERSWTARGAGFRLLDEGGLFTITVATPSRVDQLCFPLETNGRFSCARNGWIAINSDRWFGATDAWPADLDTYRRYLINHEVGHYIVGPGHPGCPGVGELAPIMMQQTKGLNGCEPNGWVEP